MYKSFFLSVVFLCSLTGCETTYNKESHIKVEDPADESLIVDLNSSTNLILKLFENKNITSILQDGASPSDIQRLIKNASPAQIALEAEVLSCTLPVLVFFYAQHEIDLLTELKRIVLDLKPQIKLVLVDYNELFSIVQNAKIDRLPTISLIDNNEELACYEGVKKEDLDQVKKELLSLLATKSEKTEI